MVHSGMMVALRMFNSQTAIFDSRLHKGHIHLKNTKNMNESETKRFAGHLFLFQILPARSIEKIDIKE